MLVLLFGAKRLPDAARSLGRSMRIFKSEVKEMGNDDEQATPPAAAPPREVEGRVVEPGPSPSAAATPPSPPTATAEPTRSALTSRGNHPGQPVRRASPGRGTPRGGCP